MTSSTPTRQRYAMHPREYAVTWEGREIIISRYDNHGRFIANAEWCVAYWPTGGPGRASDITNVFYLGADGTWNYKSGIAFKTSYDAYEALQLATTEGFPA